MYGSYLYALLSLMLGPSPGSQEKLSIVVLEGQGAINNVSRRSAHDPVVQVLDENQRPVAGATVTFLLPRSGPGGSFLNGAGTVTTITDEQGRATGRGLQPNSTTGPFDIEVRASSGDRSAGASIRQINAAPAREASAGQSRKFILLGVMAGAVAGVVAATSGGDARASGAAPPSSPAPAATVTAGTPGFGPPR
jgi:hypothetical protein